MNKLIEKLRLEEQDILEIAFARPSRSMLKKVPKTQQSTKLVRHICSHDGLALQYVSKKLITDELCEVSVKQNGMSLRYVPSRYLTNELCYEAVLNNGDAIQFIPDYMKTDRIIEKAIYSKTSLLHSQDQSILRKEMSDYFHYPIYFVPEYLLTEQLIKKSIENSPLSLKDIPNKLKSKDLCMQAISLNGFALKFVPKKYYSKLMISKVLEGDPLAIMFVPLKFITQELCDELFEQDYRALAYFPEKYVTIDMCIKLVEKGLLRIDVLDNYGYYDDEVGDDLIEFEDIPRQIQNNQIFLNVIKESDEYNFNDILEWNDYLIDEDDNNKNRRGNVIKPLYGRTVDFIKQNLEELSEKLINEKYDIVSSNDVNFILNKIKQYFFNEDKFTSIQELTHLNPKCDSNDLEIIVHDLSTNQIQENIYYISDIHLEHQIIGELMKINDESLNYDFSKIDIEEVVDKIIDEKVSEMVYEKKGILLVAGDVADSVGLYEKFYRSLQFRWDGLIVSVLGNHELWDGTMPDDWENFNYIPRSINEIVHDYRMVHHRNCYLLENELLIIYKNDRYRTICEDDILNSSENDLKEVLNDSTLIVLGGIGFSGLNEFYNAERGLYRKAILSLDDDKRMSKKFNDIYKKVEYCAQQKQIIVLTHNPTNDWLDEPLNPNWIYVNGHTHKNAIRKDENGAMIFSDNQVGYVSKKWKLNSFVLDKLYFDPFDKYGDGIYRISSKEYRDFNRGRGIASEGCNYEGDLYALKREKMYMFILKTSSSMCLMMGGSRKKLQNKDVSYYYDNMLDYANIVLEIIEPYQKVINQLAKEIQSIGGTGKIHGCIVDISFFSHIYLNPYDGKITPYYALDTSSRKVYKDIIYLLKEKEPDLIDNFNLKLHDHRILLLENSIKDNVNDLNEVAIPKWVFGNDMYYPSRMMKSVQYVWEQNVIRIWNDDVLKKENEYIDDIHIKIL